MIIVKFKKLYLASSSETYIWRHNELEVRQASISMSISVSIIQPPCLTYDLYASNVEARILPDDAYICFSCGAARDELRCICIYDICDDNDDDDGDE